MIKKIIIFVVSLVLFSNIVYADKITTTIPTSFTIPTTRISTTYTTTSYITTTIDYIKIDNIDKKIDLIINKIDNVKYLDKIFKSVRYNINFHGTEYGSGDYGKAWLQLLDENQSTIDDATCFLSIYSPDNTKYLDYAQMNFIGEGVYEYDLITPMPQGVYPMLGECYLASDSAQEKETADAQEIIRGNDYSGSYLSTHISDNNRHVVKEVTPSPRQFDLVYNFTNFCEPDESVMTGITVFWEGQWKSNVGDYVNIYLWNYTSNSWIELPNKIYYTPSGDVTVSNVISLSNTTTAGITDKPSGTVRVRFADINVTDGQNNAFKTDYLYVSCNSFGIAKWQIIRGSSELHVINGKLYKTILTSVKFVNNTIYGGYAYLNFTLVSYAHTTYEDEDIEFEMPIEDCPCYIVDELRYFNSSTGSWEQINFTTEWDDSIKTCVVHFTKDLEKDGIDYYSVKVVNKCLREVLQKKKYSNVYYTVLNAFCNIYFDKMNYTKQSVPLSQIPDIGDNTYENCMLFYDNYYYFNNSYNYLVSINVSTIDDFNNFIKRYIDFNNQFDILKYNYDSLITEETIISLVFIDNSTLAEINETQFNALQSASIPLNNYLLLQNISTNVSNMTLDYDYILNNITSEINTSENNIIKEINITGDNIIDEINTTGNNIINTLNISIYDIRDYLYNTIISARDYIISVLNQSIWQSNEDIKTNITSEINTSENNIINEINITGNNIIDEIRRSCNITENITANITAECNPREIWKYFYVNPLKTENEKTKWSLWGG